MGWGVLVSPRDYDDDDCYLAFYCNTGDEAFGPLFGVTGSAQHVKTAFYRAWPEACRAVIGREVDPRSVDPNMLHRLTYLTVLFAGVESYQTLAEYNEMWGGDNELWGGEQE